MKKLILLAVAALMLNSTVLAQDFTPSFKYRITLKDKKHNPYSLSRPEEFLSKKSILNKIFHAVFGMISVMFLYR